MFDGRTCHVSGEAADRPILPPTPLFSPNQLEGMEVWEPRPSLRGGKAKLRQNGKQHVFIFRITGGMRYPPAGDEGATEA
jgi:hypothetical protein